MEPLCRLCLQSGSDLGPIGCEENSEDDASVEQNLVQLILRYLSIQIVKTEDTGYPLICDTCRSQITQWHRFYTSCNDNDGVYQQLQLSGEHDEACFDHQAEQIAPKEESMDASFEELSEAGLYLEIEPVDVRIGDLSKGSNSTSETSKDRQKSKDSHRKRGKPGEKALKKQLKSSADSNRSPEKRGAKATKKSRRKEMCTLCGKFFSNLPQHMRNHNNVRQYQCSFCSKTFIGRSNYFAHVNIHTHEKMFKCQLCDKQYIHAKGLKQHEAKHTNERKYVCKLCDKSYFQETSLIRHRRTHFEEPQINCPQCDRVFFTRGDLNRHSVTHSLEKQLSCEICRRAFNRKDNLKTHMKIHQPKATSS